MQKPTTETTDDSQSPVTDFELNVSRWVLLFLGFIFVVLVFSEIFVAAGWLNPQPIDGLFDMYKSVALPILTLVLGHYFGARGLQ